MAYPLDDEDAPTREIEGYKLVETCGACPEQYDVYRHGENVAYLRLRHGYFYAEVPHGGTMVYEANPEGDGIFEPDERDHFLTEAVRAIHAFRTKDL